jgi:FixJ family two-component response regulator
MDILLPDGKATGLINLVRADSSTVPIIAMSGFALADLGNLGFCVQFLQKPFTLAAFTEAVERSLKKS